MHSEEIERRLRLPAHDEPSLLPPLLLPQAGGFDLTGGRVRAGSAGGSLRLLSPRLVIALVALLAALAAASVSGAIRLDQLPNPFRTVSSFESDGVSLDYPDGWHQLTPDDPRGMSAGMTSLIVSNRDVDGCNASEMTWATPNVRHPGYAGPGRVRRGHHRRSPGTPGADLQRDRRPDLCLPARRADG